MVRERHRRSGTGARAATARAALLLPRSLPRGLAQGLRPCAVGGQGYRLGREAVGLALRASVGTAKVRLPVVIVADPRAAVPRVANFGSEREDAGPFAFAQAVGRDAHGRASKSAR